MKKSYSKAEAYKVSFNANEQVAAACYYTEEDYATKYPDGDGNLGAQCDSSAGLYCAEGVNFCVIYEDGTMYGGMGDFNDYLQYAD